MALLLLQLGGRGVSERPVRSFVAVLLPDGVRARLAATVAEIRPKAPTLAWVRADNLHLTLRFLGAVEPAALARAQEAMRVAVLARTPFTIELGGLGSFPARGAPRVVWAGVVTGGEGLAELHAALDAALGRGAFRGRAGRSTPTSPSRAHGSAAAGPAWKGCWGPALGSARCEVAALHLMRSDLGPGGARYSVLAEAPLGDMSGGD